MMLAIIFLSGHSQDKLAAPLIEAIGEYFERRDCTRPSLMHRELAM